MKTLDYSAGPAVVVVVDDLRWSCRSCFHNSPQRWKNYQIHERWISSVWRLGQSSNRAAVAKRRSFGSSYSRRYAGQDKLWARAAENHPPGVGMDTERAVDALRRAVGRRDRRYPPSGR